jgi:tetratricopeptide (TPR) repeat protein
VGEPAFAGREEEIREITRALEAAARGEGRVILVSGEAGVGKSRILEEARLLSKAHGFAAAAAAGSPEVSAPFKPWAEALSHLGLAEALEEEAPPKLHGLYVLNHSGLLVARADREGGVAVDPDLFAAMSSAVGDFLDESLSSSVGTSAGGMLRFAHGERGLCVCRGDGFALCAVFEGRENEPLFEDLRGLRDRVERRTGKAVRSWDGERGSLSELDSLLRMLLESGRYEGTPPPAEGTGRKLDIYERVIRALRRRSVESPLMLTLDSIQWFDGASVGLLRFVARNAKADRLMVLASHRTGEGERPPAFAEALNAMRNEGHAMEMELDRLGPAAARELARSAVGAPASRPEIIEEVADRSLGNPLFLLEIVRAARGAGLLDPTFHGAARQSLDVLRVPPRLRDLVAQRLSRLSAAERSLLDAASVLGAAFTTGILSEIVDQSQSSVSRSLTEIARKHLFLVEQEGRWKFNHPLMREALYEALSSDLRTLYHRDAALAIKEADGRPEEIGSHFAAAGDQRAVSYLMQAAGDARARGSVEEAAAFLRSALAVAPKESRVMLAKWQADALEESGSYADALEAVREARSAGAPKAEWAAREIRLLDGMCRWSEATRVARAALPGLGRPASGQVLAALAAAQVSMGRPEEGAKTARRALSRLAADDAGSRASAFFTVARAHLAAGRHGQAYQFFEKSLKLREGAKESRGIAASMAGVAWVHVHRGEYDAALARLYRSAAICEALGDRLGTASVMQAVGYVYYERGEHDEALDTLRQALGTLESLGVRQGVAAALHGIAVVLQERGEYAEAMEHFARCLGIRQAIGDRAGIAAAYSDIGDAFAQYGFGRSALIHIEQAIEISRALGDATVLGRAKAKAVAPRIHSGDLVRARADAESAVKIARDSGARSDEALALRALGEVLAAEERIADACDAFDRSLMCFRALKAGVKVADTLRRWGIASVSAGELELGREKLADAAEAFDEAGLEKRAAEVRRELSRLGGEG